MSAQTITLTINAGTPDDLAHVADALHDARLRPHGPGWQLTRYYDGPHAANDAAEALRYLHSKRTTP